jgi:RNA polymerase sigma-70 factor (sigma-E family)
MSGAAGGPETFEAFVAHRTPALLRTAYLLTGDQAAAEDLVQTAMVKVSTRWTKICSRGSPEPYVRRVMYREHVTAWRRVGAHESAGLDDRTDDALPDPAADVALRLTIEQALQRLGRRQRAVIVLRYYDDLPEAAVAEALGCSVGTVRSQTSKALARLRQIVPSMLEEVPSG